MFLESPGAATTNRTNAPADVTDVSSPSQTKICKLH